MLTVYNKYSAINLILYMQNDKYKELSIQASKEAYSSLLKTMQKSGLENLVLFREENIRYVSALPLIISLRATSDSYAAIVDNSGVRVITSEDEYRRLNDYGSWVEIEKYGSEGLIGKINQELNETKEIGYEDNSILYYLYQKLSTTYKMRPASTIISQTRVYKNSYEKELIKKAAEILTHAINEVPNIYKEGMTEAELQGELEKIMRKEGAEGFGTWGLLTSSDGLKYVHYFPKHTKKIQGMLNVNISVNFYGYYADIARIFYIEKISKDIEEKYEMFKGINNKLIGMLKPNQNIGSIVEKISDEYRKLNSQLTHALGRGVGVELVEMPFIVHNINQNIEINQAISTNPWISFGDYSFKLVDTLMVEKEGAKLYTNASYDLIRL
jgi:Xaa-Pro aminopeptidase